MSVWTNIKQALGRFIPSHVNDPIGLIRRMLTSGKKAAPFTLWLTAVSILATPIDWLLQRFESKARAKVSNQPSGPHIFICGPARSGTTLVYQVLANNLDVAFVRNFTVAFSRSPVLASRLFTRKASTNRKQDYENYYGKTAGMQSPSEANHLWNQWVDVDASDFRTVLSQQGSEDTADFFNSFSATENKPTLSKNNNANAFAEVVSQSLENAYFICMKRETRYLAQSLLQARIEINGNVAQSYGVTNTNSDVDDTDPVDQVLEQIDYLNNLATAQQQKLGEDRFWIVDYEEFCNNPAALIQRVNTKILGNTEKNDSFSVPDIKHNNRCTNAELFSQIEDKLAQQ